MARSLISGTSDYFHQSILDVSEDLKNELDNQKAWKELVSSDLAEVKQTKYWEEQVPANVKIIFRRAYKHIKTTISELEDIIPQLSNGVKESHCKRLDRIGVVSSEINKKIGNVWHNDFKNKDYKNETFRAVERIYCNCRDASVNRIDIQQMGIRLKDYKDNYITNAPMNNNPWKSGSYYLVVFVTVLMVLGILATQVPGWMVIPVIFLSTIIILILNISQLRNDNRLSEQSYVELIKVSFKTLPMVRSLFKKNKTSDMD